MEKLVFHPLVFALTIPLPKRLATARRHVDPNLVVRIVVADSDVKDDDGRGSDEKPQR
jgi:hypothetical protein